MKVLKSIILLVILILAGVASNAQGCHGGGGSGGDKSTPKAAIKDYSLHGGEVIQAGKYKIEMAMSPLMKTDPMSFYLMTKKGKPICNNGITGKVECTFEDRTTETLVLEPRGDDVFVAQLTNKTKSFICIASFIIDGEYVTARFENDGIGPQNATTPVIYTCPMHPAIKTENPGNCPKCHMPLEKVKN